MKCTSLFTTFALLAVCVDATAHPIENVISLLKGLAEKVEMEGKHEALTYEKFEYWCHNSMKSLSAAIAEEKSTIEELESSIAGGKEDEESLQSQIKKLEDELQKLDASGVKATEIRAETSKLFGEADTDYASTISAVDEALAALEGARDETEASLLVSKVLPLVQSSVTDTQLSALNAFVQEEPAPDAANVKAMGDREAHVDKYASKSHSVIELLKELKQKFEAEKLAATKAETNSLNSFDLSTEARANAIKAATASKEKKSAELGEVQAKLTSDKESLASTQGDLDADETSHKETLQSCKRKKSEWEERSKTRAGELEAMAMAVKILAKATGVRTTPPNNPVPPPSPVESFLQLEASDPKMKAVELLRTEASKIHSKALERLAQEVSAHLTGPFDEVNNMIEKMIFRLMAEQKNEDDHKNWCDLELSKTNTSINDKKEKSEELNAKIAEETAAVQQLTEEITDAEAMVADIVSHMKMATEIRATGKKENALAIADSEKAQTAVAQAIAVLEDFYKESGAVKKESWEFLQAQRERSDQPMELPEEPSTWGDSYTGLSDPKQQPNGIISTLEGVASEFSTMEASTKAQEASDQNDFEQEMKDCKIEQTRRESEAREKHAEVKSRNERVASLQKALKHTDTEIEKTEQYLKDLQPACVEGDSTYEDRKAARQQEIDALGQAQGILADAFKEKPEVEASSLAHLRGKTVRKHGF